MTAIIRGLSISVGNSEDAFILFVLAILMLPCFLTLLFVYFSLPPSRFREFTGRTVCRSKVSEDISCCTYKLDSRYKGQRQFTLSLSRYRQKITRLNISSFSDFVLKNHCFCPHSVPGHKFHNSTSLVPRSTLPGAVHFRLLLPE